MTALPPPAPQSRGERTVWNFGSALAVGGLTPYADLLRQIKAELDLPVRCLMRPRAGDFLYTRDELELLCRQIETLRSAGADGFVIGALTPGGVRLICPPCARCWTPAAVRPSRCIAASTFPVICAPPTALRRHLASTRC